METDLPTIAILGASGMIGRAVVSDLRRDGFPVVAIARRFSQGQKIELGENAVEYEIVASGADALVDILSRRSVDILVNCIGVLQDSARGKTDAVHGDFVADLLAALSSRPNPALLIHLSVPGRKDEDPTPFSRSKREAERLISQSPVPFVILRPGFVIAPAAYGGGALIRALAALPIALPSEAAGSPFATIDIADISQTIAILARKWGDGERQWSESWDVMERQPSSVGDVIDAFRSHFGGPKPVIPLPSWPMAIGAKAGDLSAFLGWMPPIRSTALGEMRRGVAGDPEQWITATGIEPKSLTQALEGLPPTVQEAWFARLYLVKALVIAVLAIFWVVSGLIALTVGFDAAAAILASHGFPIALAHAVTWTTGLTDVAIGVAIAFRRTCRAGLIGGIGLSVFYLIGAAFIAPELWADPLGALVKTVPAIALMIVALAIARDRGG
jgi:uncharacterized protein YbjT (DUF2867 family)